MAKSLVMQASKLRIILVCYSRLAAKYYSTSEGSSWDSAVLGGIGLGEEGASVCFALTADVPGCFTGWKFFELCLY